MSKSPVTCHGPPGPAIASWLDRAITPVLDASMGKPAPGVKVSLECLALTGTPEEGVTADSLPQVLAHGYVVHEFQVDVQLSSRETDGDGRCSTLLPADEKLSPGVYKMVFHTGPYFEASKVSSFYPLVEITFNYTNPSQHYHIPLLLSPFSYTTYRGS